jgi:predicted TPR repeat methyltransferase
LSNRGIALTALARYREAMADFDKALALRPGFTGAWCGRANCLYRAGRNDEALVAYDKALELDPKLAEAWLGRASVLNYRLRRPADALTAYDKALAIKPDLAEAWLGRGEALEVSGRSQEAIAAFRRALAAGCSAEVIQFALAGLGAEAAPVTAPKESVTRVFDQYAGHFDDHLVGKLKYRTPETLLEAVVRFAQHDGLDIVDLGCGTGLVGSRFRPLARTLTGVDLSTRMLEVARQRQIYDNLVCSDLTEFLRTQAGNFDLALAADVFVYIGDLSAVFQGVRGALRDGGLFGFSVEASEHRDFVLGATRRYSHSKPYLRRLAEDHGFAVETIEPHIIRQQDGIDVAGYLAIWRCRPRGHHNPSG